MRTLIAIFRRELLAYFSTPLAYIFMFIFLGLSGAMTWHVGGFFDRGQADLQSFFLFHPWLYLLLMPAIGMRLWAEERKTGTLELLMTLPVTTTQAVLGKFLAAWGFTTIALALTFPMWITVNILGTPDNGVIIGGYIGSWLMAGAFLAIASALSATTKNQVVAFIIGVAVSFLLIMSGLPVVAELLAWAPRFFVDLIASMSFLTHFDLIAKGVIDLRSVIFFLSLIVVSLFANTLVIELKKAE